MNVDCSWSRKLNTLHLKDVGRISMTLISRFYAPIFLCICNLQYLFSAKLYSTVYIVVYFTNKGSFVIYTQMFRDLNI